MGWHHEADGPLPASVVPAPGDGRGINGAGGGQHGRNVADNGGAVILALLLACAGGGPAGLECDASPYSSDDWLDPRCPCRPVAYFKLTGRSSASCRADQTLRIEWEPQPTAARDENEDRVGGAAICTCNVVGAP